jgi:tetratricopeptide (TPR) repeat protein
MKPFKNLLSCAILCATAAATFVLPGCADTTGVDETAQVTAPAPPVSVAPSDDNPKVASNDGMPDFSDEPAFSESSPGQPSALASVTPPGPAAPPGLDPLRLPEPAPVDNSWRKQWVTDFEAAKALAQADGKDILVNFTGSDWCTWCIQLSKEVFSKPEFAQYAKQHFVLVEADFPQNQFGQPEATNPEHQELSEQFEVEGFPTILLFDKLGRPFGQTGYQPGGPQAYSAHLDDLKIARVERDAALDEAGKLQGVERAKKLDEALASLPSTFVFPAYESVVEEIIKLDADNTAELRSQYQDMLANHQFMTRVQAIEKLVPTVENPDSILADIDKAQADFGNDPRRGFVITMFRINVLNYFDRIDEVLKVAAEAIKNESLDADYRAQLYITQLRILNQSDRQKDAISVIDQAIADFAENDSLRMEFFLARADFLQKLNRTEEAKTAVAEARKAGGPAASFRIDQFEQSVLGTVAPDATSPLELPEPTTPKAAEKTASEASGESSAEISKPADSK